MPELLMDEGMPVARSVGGLHDALLPQVMELVDAKAAVLDVGYGSGSWLERLALNGYENIVGIDQDVGQLRSEAGQIVTGRPRQHFRLARACKVLRPDYRHRGHRAPFQYWTSD